MKGKDPSQRLSKMGFYERYIMESVYKIPTSKTTLVEKKEPPQSYPKDEEKEVTSKRDTSQRNSNSVSNSPTIPSHPDSISENPIVGSSEPQSSSHSNFVPGHYHTDSIDNPPLMPSSQTPPAPLSPLVVKSTFPSSSGSSPSTLHQPTLSFSELNSKLTSNEMNLNKFAQSSNSSSSSPSSSGKSSRASSQSAINPTNANSNNISTSSISGNASMSVVTKDDLSDLENFLMKPNTNENKSDKEAPRALSPEELAALDELVTYLGPQSKLDTLEQLPSFQKSRKSKSTTSGRAAVKSQLSEVEEMIKSFRSNIPTVLESSSSSSVLNEEKLGFDSTQEVRVYMTSVAEAGRKMSSFLDILVDNPTEENAQSFGVAMKLFYKTISTGVLTLHGQEYRTKLNHLIFQLVQRSKLVRGSLSPQDLQSSADQVRGLTKETLSVLKSASMATISRIEIEGMMKSSMEEVIKSLREDPINMDTFVQNLSHLISVVRKNVDWVDKTLLGNLLHSSLSLGVKLKKKEGQEEELKKDFVVSLKSLISTIQAH